MASVASQLIEEVTAHVQSNSLEDAREICADGSYFTNNLVDCDKDKSKKLSMLETDNFVEKLIAVGIPVRICYL